MDFLGHVVQMHIHMETKKAIENGNEVEESLFSCLNEDSIRQKNSFDVGHINALEKKR